MSSAHRDEAPGGRRPSRLRPPPLLLDRLRWSFLLFALFFVVTFMPQLLLQSPHPLPLRLVSAGLLLALGVWWVRCYERRRFPAAGLVLELTTFAAVVLTPSDPFKALGLLYIAVNFRSFYGSWRQVAAFTVLSITTFSTAVLAAPHLGLLDRAPLLAYTLPGVPVLALIGHLVAVATRRAEESVVRERTLSTAGVQFALAEDVPAVQRVAQETAATLLADVPGARAGLLLAAGPERREEQDGDRPDALLDVPLRTRRGVLGTLRVEGPGPLPLEVAEALRALAVQAALGLHTVDLTADLSHRASHDPLTDLANRARVLQQLELLLADEREGQTVAVLLLDLDGFKAVNDTCGHAAGDRLLEAVADRLRARARTGDVVGRLGGDEFVVLAPRLPVADAEELAGALADRLAAAISEPVVVDGRRVGVGVSIGVSVDVGAGAAAQEQGGVPEGAAELLRRADAAMYEVKRDHHSACEAVAAR